MFGTASALIGAGMLTGGASIEILDGLGEQTGGLVLIGLGALGAALAAYFFKNGTERTSFLSGIILLMTGAMHLGGLYLWAGAAELGEVAVPLVHFYVAAATLAMGMFIDVRLITALAIIPFAQMLDTTCVFSWGVCGATLWGKRSGGRAPEAGDMMAPMMSSAPPPKRSRQAHWSSTNMSILSSGQSC